MSEKCLRVLPDTYVDSVLLMSATRRMHEAGRVAWAAAVMGTEANLRELRKEGFGGGGEIDGVRVNDLILAAAASRAEEAEAALAVGLSTVGGRAARTVGEPSRIARPRGLEEAEQDLPGANLAMISVPGPYAALEAHKALSAGLHVLLFSDNVSLEDEVALKERAASIKRFVMGPGAGTSMVGGVGLGFANVVRRGPVGVVAASGTGAQEVMVLLDNWGSGVSAVIGVGGRDLSIAVGARMARLALRALREDERTELLLLVSKPPAPAVAEALLEELAGLPAVVAFVGLDEEVEPPGGVRLARSLEEAVIRALEALGQPAPDPAAGLAALAEEGAAGLDPGRRVVRGLFSGGTLCYESMVGLSRHLGPIHSNVPLREAWALPAPPGSHVCLDLGEEEFTRGRPHPMIDPEPRAEWIVKESRDPEVAVILLDVVLGYGAHPDPASVLGPACREAIAGGVAVVAHVVGTDRDPQAHGDQVRALRAEGCLLAPTGARAALLAAAVAARRPGLAEAVP